MPDSSLPTSVEGRAGYMVGYMHSTSNKAQSCGLGQVLDLNGAGEKSRTPDLRITNALLYQLSYAGPPLAGRTHSGERKILAQPGVHTVTEAQNPASDRAN